MRFRPALTFVIAAATSATSFPLAADELCDVVNRWSLERGYDNFTETMAQMVTTPASCEHDPCSQELVHMRDSRPIDIIWNNGSSGKLSDLSISDPSSATPEMRATVGSMTYVILMMKAYGFELIDADLMKPIQDHGSIMFVILPRKALMGFLQNNEWYGTDLASLEKEFNQHSLPCYAHIPMSSSYPTITQAQVLVDADQEAVRINACIVEGAFRALGLDAPDGQELFEDAWGSFGRPVDAPELVNLWTQRDLTAIGLLYGALDVGMTQDEALREIRDKSAHCQQ